MNKHQRDARDVASGFVQLEVLSQYLLPFWVLVKDESLHKVSGTWPRRCRRCCRAVQALLQSGRLKFAEKLPFREVLQEELQKFRAKIDIASGHATFEHWREKDTDDLVLALAIACWHAKKRIDYSRVF